jgi:hypothetical protein
MAHFTCPTDGLRNWDISRDGSKHLMLDWLETVVDNLEKESSATVGFGRYLIKKRPAAPVRRPDEL